MNPVAPVFAGQWLVPISLAAATLVSEDLACATAGALVSEGRTGFAAATAGCFSGIVIGDLLLFALGRIFGPRVLGWPPLKQLVPSDAVSRSSEWLERRGPVVVLLSRFTPGTRLPTCLLAGALHTSAKQFLLWFTLAAAIWTPLIVGASAAAGGQLDGVRAAIGGGLTLEVLVLVLLLAGVIRIVTALASWPERRRLHGRWQRLKHWEFWPMWAVYPPVLAYIGWLMVQYRGATVFTAANPGIPGGGFVGESKFDILCKLAPAGEFVARAALLPAGTSPQHRIRIARLFIEQAALTFPIVVKPDKGQRGSGVTIVRTPEALEHAIRATTSELILQEFAPGHEFGVFYARHPASESGHIISITEKRFPHVAGDGRRTLEQLILSDERAVCLERLHCRVHREKLRTVPAAGDPVQLVEVGSHCRGALFLDTMHLLTPQLEETFDRIAKGFHGFCFGRFDVRTPSIEDFRLGRNFKIVELNGVTSEATHIYDPKNGLLTALHVLCAQWRLAFDVGAANVRRGAKPTPLAALVSMVLHAWRAETDGNSASIEAGLGVRP